MEILHKRDKMFIVRERDKKFIADKKEGRLAPVIESLEASLFLNGQERLPKLGHRISISPPLPQKMLVWPTAAVAVAQAQALDLRMISPLAAEL